MGRKGENDRVAVVLKLTRKPTGVRMAQTPLEKAVSEILTHLDSGRRRQSHGHRNGVLTGVKRDKYTGGKEQRVQQILHTPG